MWQTKYASAVHKNLIFGHAVKAISSPSVASVVRVLTYRQATPKNSVRPKFGIGRKYRPKPLVSVSVSEPKLLQPKPKLQYIDFSEITLSTYVHVLHGKSEIT